MCDVIDIENSKTIQQIGLGGFGKIYLCEDNKGKQFVSKQISNLDSFLTEVQIYSGLREETDYFPRFYNYFNGELKKCIFMENCQQDLRSMFDKKEEICHDSFILHISKGLQILKNKQIIHCDLKPDNILYDERTDLFKICDFGISCFNSKKRGFPVQTVYYRAPEVIARKDYDQSVDIWSFGCIIHEMIYGRILFQYKEEIECFFWMIVNLGLPPKDFYQIVYEKSIRYEGKEPIFYNVKNDEEYYIDISKMSLPRETSSLVIKRCLQWIPEDRITPSEIIDLYEDDFF